MANIYVRVTGNDTTGNGSDALPWRTISKAYLAAVAGDVIKVGAGTYAENTSGVGYLWLHRSFASAVTVERETLSDVVTVTGTSGFYNTRQGASVTNTTFRGINFGVRSGSWWALAFYASSTVNTSGLVFEDCTVTDDAAQVNSVPVLFEMGAGTAGSWSGTFTRLTVTQNATNAAGAAAITIDQTNQAALHTIVAAFTDCVVTSVGKPARLIGGTFTVYRGTWTAGSGAGKVGIQLGADGTTGKATTGLLSGVTISSPTSHALLIGAGCSGVIATGLTVTGGDYAVVLKSCVNCSVSASSLSGGTLSTVLLKGATGCTVAGNTITNATSYAVSNYDGQATYKSSTCLVVGNTIVVSGTAGAIRWEALGDLDETCVVDANRYGVTAPANFGDVVGAADVAGLPALRLAWSGAGYGAGTNDANSLLLTASGRPPGVFGRGLVHGRAA